MLPPPMTLGERSNLCTVSLSFDQPMEAGLFDYTATSKRYRQSATYKWESERS